MTTGLLITNISYTFFVVITLASVTFIIYQAPRKKANILFGLYCLILIIFELSISLGINTFSNSSAKTFFILGLVILILPALSQHWVSAFLGDTRKIKIATFISYLFGFTILIFSVLKPELIFGLPLSKMYFPNFPTPGPFFFIIPAYMAITGLFSIAILVSKSKSSGNSNNRLTFILWGLTGNYIFLASFLPLLYNTAFDPLWLNFTGLSIILLVYGILNFEPSSAESAAKRALLYGVGVAGVGIFIILINIISNTVTSMFPNFPIWLIPLASGIVAVSAGSFVWHKIREVDKLKYEFVTVLTHKLRTPLTYVKWSIDSLRKETSGEAGLHDIDIIENANANLTETVNRLMKFTKTENNEYQYNIKPEKSAVLLQEILDVHQNQAKEKNVLLKSGWSPDLPEILVDSERFKYALHIIMENAIKYSPDNSEVVLSAELKDKNIIIKVEDKGIGVSEEEQYYLFSKFFRGSRAKTTDTEGMGIDLPTAKEIIERLGGSIWVTSAGENKGSIFFVKLKTV